jgi:hypothetical protein
MLCPTHKFRTPSLNPVNPVNPLNP